MCRDKDPRLGFFAVFFSLFALFAGPMTGPQATFGRQMKNGTYDTVLGPLSYDKKGDITAIGCAVYRRANDGNYDEITDLSKS